IGVGTVGVSGIPEENTLVVSGVEQFGDTFVAESASLVRTATEADGAGTHGHAADRYFSGSEKNTIRCILGFGGGEEVVRKIRQGDCSRARGMEKTPAIH